MSDSTSLHSFRIPVFKIVKKSELQKSAGMQQSRVQIVSDCERSCTIYAEGCSRDKSDSCLRI
ncbi:MAG: hypothetical protein CME31_20725 [Gimesia sp.]|uniref:Uncharacterized protein n=1 Tax=Gimesia maris TaxID=122 RepID=A0A3D3RBJ7_9PLAN|nr:hypothetical protein [Gimesia sp.]HCO26179.1 hypothetical protein [Gimesia maris]